MGIRFNHRTGAIETGGNLVAGNYEFDTDQTVGAGQDNYVLTYDNATGLISLEVVPAAGGGLTASDSPTITGVWTFSNKTYFTYGATAGARNSSLVVYNGNPQISIEDTGAAVNEGVWNIIGGTTSLKIRALSDDYATSADAMGIIRGTGAVVDNISFYRPIISDMGGGQVMIIKDDVVGGNPYNAWIQWKDSSNVDQGYIGFGSAGNETFYINNQSGGDILLNTSGDVDLSCGATGALEITGSSYKTNPTGLRLGQYTSTIGYVQAPAGGRIAMWTDATGEIASFNDDLTTSFNGAISVNHSTAAYREVFKANRVGDTLKLGNDGGGQAAVLGTAYQTSAAANDYRVYFAYDCYWNEDTNAWYAVRTTLGRKWKAEMGYHANTFEVATYDGVVSSSWNDTAWSKRLTVADGYTEVQTASGYVQLGPVNTSYCHFTTDRTKFYFNKEVHVNGNIVDYNSGSARPYLHLTNTGMTSGGNVTFSTSAASGGSSGDIWYQYV